MEATIGGIFRAHFDDYQKRYPQPLHKRKAVSAMQRCRTAGMGGHVQRCPHGHVSEVHYNSCKHRSCPRCSALPAQRWLTAYQTKLLDCDHYHAILTIPHYLIELWQCNQRLMGDLLFRCGVETLTELLADPRYLGAMVGILAALHTWGRDLIRHPHLHCLITGGGWTPDGQWVPVTGDYLLPYRVVRKVFRGKYVAGLRKAYAAGELQLPRGLSESAFDKLMGKVGRRVKWNTRICERYGHGVGVATYLARYLRGGPLRNQQIKRIEDGRVIFGFTDHRTQRKAERRLTLDEFMRRILWHIPEKGHHLVRHYGLYHAHKAPERARCRAHLGQLPEPVPVFLDWQAYLERLDIAVVTRCPVCGAALEAVQIDPHQQSPPVVASGQRQAYG